MRSLLRLSVLSCLVPLSGFAERPVSLDRAPLEAEAGFAAALSAAAQVPVFLTLQEGTDLDRILRGETFCRAQAAREAVSALESVPGLYRNREVLVTVAPHVSDYCGRWTALLFFQKEGRMVHQIRRTSGELWVEDSKGVVAKWSEVEDYILGLALEYRTNPPAVTRPIERYFTLVNMALPRERSSSWRLESDPGVRSPELVVNQGDTLHLTLVNSLSSNLTVANFTLRLRRRTLSYDVFGQNGSQVKVPPLVAEEVGQFEFFDGRNPDRIVGKLVVRPLPKP